MFGENIITFYVLRRLMKKLALAGLLAATFSLSTCFAAAPSSKHVAVNVSKKDDGKKPFKLEAGDCTLTISGKTKIEHYFDRNIALLNKTLPDECNYFKNTFDLSFDMAYGKKTFGHDAVKAFTKLRHKGIWGRGAVFADSDGMSPAPIKLSDSVFGGHSHTSGKPLLWINEAWLQFSINAIANVSADRLHTIKLGWFPFDMGRGIALGSVYGLNRQGFGLNTYPEDKGAPGILLHGDVKKDVLSYDLYYAKFECRSKSLGDTLNSVKEPLLGRKTTPWRGVGKDTDLFAGRLKWKPLSTEDYGTLELEPYAFYMSASDQMVKIVADSHFDLGTIGMAAEHSYNGFEFGVEGAFNMGNQLVHAIDQNKIEMKRQSDGRMAEQFSYILLSGNNALVTDASKAIAKQMVTNNSTPLGDGTYTSKAGRILPEYVNKLRGYMVVADVTKKFEDYKVDLSAAYGFASGDENPNSGDNKRYNKTHMGFLGLHESYSGKRVSSFMFLDEMRGVLSIPGAVSANANSVDNTELEFTNLHHLGFGSKWTPTVAGKPFTFNPNMLFYWRAIAPKKWDNANQVTTDQNASRFIGSEFNLKTKMVLLKDLELFGNFGVFIPGRMFKDMQGIPFANSTNDKVFNTNFFDQLSEDAEVETDGLNALNDLKQQYRLGTNVAYTANIGLSYAF